VAARSPLHALTWAVWAVAAAVTVELAPSPVYVALVIAVAALVVSVHRQDTPLARAFPVLVAVGVAFGLLRVVLTALTVHNGTPVLFTLPAATLPRALGGFTVGGAVSLPVVLQSAAESFAIVGIMAAFGAFNAVVSHHELVKVIPRAFYEVGLIVTVAIAFVPSTIAAVHRVIEADRARVGGQRPPRRGRLVRRAVPLIESGAEQAIALAESMDSRGFGRDTVARSDRIAAAGGFAALLALSAAFVALVAEATRPAAVFAAIGGLTLLLSLVAASRRSRHPRYRRRPVTRRDQLVALVVIGAPVVVAGRAFAGDDALVWSTSPLHTPAVSWITVVAVALLAVPAFTTRAAHD
jgi:energy-coupling factor transport system permease protein